jgi:hypothetical protein
VRRPSSDRLTLAPLGPPLARGTGHGSVGDDTPIGWREKRAGFGGS